MTPQSDRIMDILLENKGWMTRSEIATVMNKNRLNVWDVALLDMLVEEKLIAKEQHKITGGIGFAWKYKAITAEKGGQ